MRNQMLLVFALSVYSIACGRGSGNETTDAPTRVESYALQSQLDLSGQLPAGVGSAIAELVDATDSPDDPTRFLVDKMLAKMQPSSLKTALEDAEPFVTAYVNDQLLSTSPGFVGRLVELGRDLGQVLHQLGTLETLEIPPTGGAIHSITGLVVVLDGQSFTLPFAAHDLPPVFADDVEVSARENTLAIGPHVLTMSLGKLVRLVVDGALVPHVDPDAVDLLGVLQGGVDCVSFANTIANALDVDAQSELADLCQAALADLATTIYSEIDSADDSLLELDLSGAAEAFSSSTTEPAPALTDGRWVGTVGYAGTPEPLTSGTFVGTLQP